MHEDFWFVCLFILKLGETQILECTLYFVYTHARGMGMKLHCYLFSPFFFFFLLGMSKRNLNMILDERACMARLAEKGQIIIVEY